MAKPQKLVLGAEIIAAYLRCRRDVSRDDIRNVVEAIRAQPPACRRSWEAGSLEERLIAARLGNAVTRTLSVLPSDSRCLMRSLVLMSLLTSRGIRSTLVIGAHSRPAFSAHAWVEHRGHPVLAPEYFYESRLLEI